MYCINIQNFAKSFMIQVVLFNLIFSMKMLTIQILSSILTIKLSKKSISKYLKVFKIVRHVYNFTNILL